MGGRQFIRNRKLRQEINFSLKYTEMKNIFFLDNTTTFNLGSGNVNTKKDAIRKASKADEPEKLYACPIHPEIQGKLNDKCVQCGMPLTVLVP